jgi:hypothetical protein
MRTEQRIIVAGKVGGRIKSELSKYGRLPRKFLSEQLTTSEVQEYCVKM